MIALLLAYEHWLVRPDDLTRVNKAFFQVNGVISLGLLALVLVLGGATLLLHNRLFIQWKPTVLFWVVSAAFIAGYWIGERTLTQRFLEPALAGRVPVSPQQWRRVNAASAAFYSLLGVLNLAVAYGASERTWVYFKLFGLALLTFAFVALQVLWLSRAAAPLPAPASASDASR